MCLEQILCFKHSRKVAKDNTVRFQLHTLQLLPGPERPSYAGTVVEVLAALDGTLSVRRDGRIIPALEAPPAPVFLRNGSGPSAAAPLLPSGPTGLAERWNETLAPLNARADDAEDSYPVVDSAAAAAKPAAKSARKPTFLQKARWKAIQKAQNKGMSLRRIERELGIHRGTIKKYLEAEGPPVRRSSVTPTRSDTIKA